MPRTWTAVPERARVPAETAVPEQRWPRDRAAAGRGSGKAGSEGSQTDGTEDLGSFAAGLEISRENVAEKDGHLFFCSL